MHIDFMKEMVISIERNRRILLNYLVRFVFLYFYRWIWVEFNVKGINYRNI